MKMNRKISIEVALTLFILCVVCLSTTSADNQPKLEIIPKGFIFYKLYNSTSITKLTDSISESLQDYKKRDSNSVICSYDRPRRQGEVCTVDFREFNYCIQENYYSYHKGAPCVFLKLNGMQGWIPEYYNDSSKLPITMPQSLKQQIQTLETENRMKVNNIWVSCNGENAVDIELIGPVEYFPRQGFPSYYFPIENPNTYQSPLIAIHFKRPAWNIVINIECKLWARNINQDRDSEMGVVRFPIFVD